MKSPTTSSKKRLFLLSCFFGRRCLGSFLGSNPDTASIVLIGSSEKTWFSRSASASGYARMLVVIHRLKPEMVKAGTLARDVLSLCVKWYSQPKSWYMSSRAVSHPLDRHLKMAWYAG